MQGIKPTASCKRLDINDGQPLQRGGTRCFNSSTVDWLSYRRAIQPYWSNTKISRSVCANLAEAYGKRRYLKHFRAKLTDSAAENFETQTWLDFALRPGYISHENHTICPSLAIEVGKLITYMEHNPRRFLARPFPDTNKAYPP